MSSPRSHCALVVLFLSLLFTRRLKDGSTQPMFTFEEALDFLLQNRRKIFKSSPGAIFQRVFRPAEKGEGEALSEDFQGAVDSQGHNAAICKTKWTSSGNITSGSYEFIDVVPVQSGSSMWQSRYFVDLDFAAQFEIARPSSQYSRLLQLLPRNFVGSSEDLKRIVRVTCDAAKRSLKSTDLSVPPWRKNRYVQNKWFGPYKRTVNPLTERTFSTDSAIFAPVSGAKCRCVGFDDAVSDSTVNGRLYVRT